MLICLECGKVFDEDDIEYWEESRGEYWGMPCTEKMSGCPRCQGAYEEAEECEKCGKYYPKNELDENNLCEDCQEEE